jgi:hypothetical protein
VPRDEAAPAASEKQRFAALEATLAFLPTHMPESLDPDNDAQAFATALQAIATAAV